MPYLSATITPLILLLCWNRFNLILYRITRWTYLVFAERRICQFYRLDLLSTKNTCSSAVSVVEVYIETMKLLYFDLIINLEFVHIRGVPKVYVLEMRKKSIFFEHPVDNNEINSIYFEEKKLSLLLIIPLWYSVHYIIAIVLSYLQCLSILSIYR